eukprot:scaffold30437_cov54-Phaeocystis_antarctica.AAC.2
MLASVSWLLSRLLCAKLVASQADTDCQACARPGAKLVASQADTDCQACARPGAKLIAKPAVRPATSPGWLRGRYIFSSQFTGHRGLL